ncbi:MAG: hypothetical protein KGN76_17445 [Acidobacteriota bacterium]|nr:hypothetical protein [Acidobacteriota bacterium]
MKRIMCALVVSTVLAAGIAPAAAASRQLTVGIVPFDVASVDGSGEQASTALAKLVRIEMIREHALRPLLLTPPPGATTPIPDDQAVTIGRAAHADVVVVGTVIDADTSTSTHSADTGGLLSGLGASLGAHLDRVTAHVTLHLDLIDPAAGKLVDSFEVEAKKSQSGVGADFSTTLGGFDSGDDAWSNSPMGKALREAAQKVTTELAKRASEFQH